MRGRLSENSRPATREAESETASIGEAEQMALRTSSTRRIRAMPVSSRRALPIRPVLGGKGHLLS